MKPHVRLAFCDPRQGFNWVRLEGLLRERFELVLDYDNPDFIIYSVAGYEHLNFPNAIRIFVTAENVSPDFNLCDYAFGFDHLSFGDRFARLPNFVLYEHYRDIEQRRRSTISLSDLKQDKLEFCNFIYSNPAADPMRDALFQALGDIGQVQSAGGHLNNVGEVLGQAYLGDWPGEKVAFQKRFRFSICAENTSYPGYTTEKVVHALAADTLPIYYGDPRVCEVFNRDRLISLHDYDSLDSLVSAVRALEQDPEALLAKLNAPFFINDEPPVAFSKSEILARFASIFSQGRQDARRRSRYVWGKLYEERRIIETRPKPEF